MTTLQAAQARYDLVVATARTEYLRDLKILLHRAMQSENIEQANVINQHIRLAETESHQPANSPAEPVPIQTPVRFHVKAAEDWQKAMTVHKGDKLWFKAMGRWCIDTSARSIRTCDADGLGPDGAPIEVQPAGLLMGRIGKHLIVIGSENQIVVPENGALELRVSDILRNDNDGEIVVDIRKAAGSEE